MNIKRIMSVITTYKFMRFIIILAIFLAITTNFACQEATDSTINGLPPLTDTIPYEKLGQGKLVFERIGPSENNYSGVYVIDIYNQSSWGIGSGVFDSPVVSPNGQKIAFTRHAGYPADTLFDVHIMDIDGSNIQNVTFMEKQDRTPSWTPDSSQILFWVALGEPPLYRQSPVPNPVDRTLIKTFSYEGTKLWVLYGPFSVSRNLKLTFAAAFSSAQGIYTMDIDGSNLRKIAPTDSSQPGPFYSPAWSPDGQKIACLLYSRDFNYDFTSLELIVMNADGSNPRSLAKFETTNVTGIYSGHNEMSLCWSPDGSKIAFNKKEEGHLISHIYIINSDGSGLTQVTFAEGVTDRSISWSNY